MQEDTTPEVPTFHHLLADLIANLFGGRVTHCGLKRPEGFYFCSHKGVAAYINFDEALEVIKIEAMSRMPACPHYDVPECLEYLGTDKEKCIYSMLVAISGGRYPEK